MAAFNNQFLNDQEESLSNNLLLTDERMVDDELKALTDADIFPADPQGQAFTAGVIPGPDDDYDEDDDDDSLIPVEDDDEDDYPDLDDDDDIPDADPDGDEDDDDDFLDDNFDDDQEDDEDRINTASRSDLGTDASKRDHGRTSGRMIDHEPGISGDDL